MPLDPSQIEDLRRKCIELEALVSTKEEELKAAKENSNQLMKIEQELLATKEQKQQSDERADQLSTEMTDLKNEINTLLQARQQLEHEVTYLKGKIADVEASLEESESEKLVGKIQTLENEIEETSRFRDQLDQAVQGLRSALSNLQLKDNGEKLERQKLVEIEQTAEERVQDTKTELSEQSDEKEALEEQVRKSMEELTTMVLQLEQSAHRVSSLEKQISEIKLEMLQELADTHAELGALREARDDRDAKLAEVERVKIKLEEQLETVRKELQAEQERGEQSKRSAVGEVEDEKQTLVEELQKLREDYEVQLKERDNELLQTKDLLEGKIEELTQIHETALKTEQERTEELTCTVTKLEQIKLDLEKNIRVCESKVHELTQSHEEALKTEQERSEKLTAAVEELEHRLEESIHELEAFVKAEKERCNELQVRIDELEQTNLSLEVQINALRENHESTLSTAKRELEEKLRSVDESYKTLQDSHAALLEANQRLEMQNVQLNADLTNQRSMLVIAENKLESVNQQMSEKYLELDDLKRKYSTKSKEVEFVKSEKDQINAKMSQQLKEFESCRKELTHLAQIQVPSMQSTIQQLNAYKEDLERKLLANSEELTQRTSEIHNLQELCAREKALNKRLEEQLEEAKLSQALQPDGRPSLGDGKVAQALRKENEDLLKQLNELQKMHLFKTKQLQDRIDDLKNIEVEYGKLKDEMATMRHDSSFQEKEVQKIQEKVVQKINHYEQVYEETNTKHRSLQRQNDELRMWYLVMEMDDLRRIADKDRKSRRQSTHDDRRGVVTFNTRDSASMTDPSSTDCSCLDMDAQIKNLKKQLTIKDCQINTQKKLASANPLKNDIVELRNLLKDRERDILTLQEEIRTLSLATADKRCNTCLRQQRMRALRSDKAVGTDHEDCTRPADVVQQGDGSKGLAKKLEEAQEELRKLNEKYQQMKRLCRIRNEKIQDLVGKENESSVANHSVQQEVSMLRRQLKESEDKYSTMQRMYQSKCNGGVAKAERTVQTETKNDEMEMLRTKYKKYKTMSIALSEQLMELKRRVPSN